MFGEGTPFWCFSEFLLTSFAKILDEGYTSPLPHGPLCASMIISNNDSTVKPEYNKYPWDLKKVAV
jgi:hypothetical protein